MTTGKNDIKQSFNEVHDDPAVLREHITTLETIVAAYQSELAALRERQDLIQTFLDQIPLVLFVKDCDGRYVLTSRRFETLLGAAPGALLGKTDYDCMPHEIAEQYRARNQATLETGTPLEIQEELLLPEGPRTYTTSMFPLYNAQGQPSALGGFAIDITTRRAVEAVLRGSEERFRTVADFTYDWEYWLDPSGGYRYVSPSCLRITGYAPDEFYADPDLLQRIVHPDDRASVAVHLTTESHQHAGVDELEFRIITRDGDVRWIGHACQPVYADDGRWLGQRASNRDITKRKEAEEAYHLLVEHSLQGLTIHQDGRCVFTNSTATEITGYAVAELLAMSPAEAAATIYPEDREMVIQRGRERQQGVSVPQHYEFRIIRKDGAVRWLEAFALQVSFRGKPAAQMAYIDITERKQAEAALRESEARYRNLVENFPDGVVLLFDQDLRYLAAGGKQLSRLGLTPDMLEGKTLREALPPEVADIGEPLYRATLAGTASAEVEQYYGDRIYRTQPVSLHNDQGQIVAGMIISQDITERKRAEAALRESQRFIQRVTDMTPGFVYVFDMVEQRNIFVNNSVFKLLGYTADEIQALGTTLIPTLLHPDDMPRVLEKIQRFETASDGDIFEQEYRMQHANGEWLWLSSKETGFLFDDEGRMTQVLGTAQDITERKQTEEELRQVNAELSQRIKELKQRNTEMRLLNEMGDRLQSCQNLDEAYTIITSALSRLFEGQAGVLYRYQAAIEAYEQMSQWGALLPDKLEITSEDYQALEQGTVAYRSGDGTNDKVALYVPLHLHGNLLGVLHLQNPHNNDGGWPWRWLRLARVVAGHIALALTNVALREQLRDQAIRDALTGLFNRRYLDEMLQRELQRAARQQEPVGIIMLDIDHFKQFNDIYGHDGGDVLLQAVGNFLADHTRSADIACRYGGEEFMLVLPGATLEDTCLRAEQLRNNVQRIAVKHNGQKLRHITASLGVASFPLHGDTDDALIKAADQALYQAKRSGRDCVIVAGTVYSE